MAHIGEIIDADILRKNYEVFQLFLKFMPEISKAKIELAPKASVSVVDLNKYELTQDMMILADKIFPHENTYDDKAYDDKAYDDKAYDDKAYDDKAKKFKVRKGKTGLKDSEGNILVPANYDNFGFLPRLYVDYKRRSVIAIRDSRYVLVALDGSGKELTKDTYDDIRLADNRKKNPPYIYRKNGRRLWGIMDELGNEICENIIDNYICSENSLLYESNELRGYWHFAEPTSSFIPPIYDDIDIMEDPKKTLVFTLNGMSGYVRHDGTFLSREELKRKAEMGEEIIRVFLCESYED